MTHEIRSNANHLNNDRVTNISTAQSTYRPHIEKTSSAEDIIKLKAEIFDIILRREEYMAVANELQQIKAQKLQQLANAQKDQQSQNMPKQPDIKQPL